MSHDQASQVESSIEQRSGGIQKLHVGLARRISSGQAVLDISCAVKELLDNALDAKSSLVEVGLFLHF